MPKLRFFWLGVFAVWLTGCVTSKHEDTESSSKEIARPAAAQPPANTDSAFYMPGMPSTGWTPVPFRPAPSGPAPRPQLTGIEAFPGTWVPLNRWTKAHGLAVPAPADTGGQQAYDLVTTNGTFRLRVGSTSAAWDGLEVRLGYAPQIIDGQPYLHTLDVQKTLWPLARSQPRPALQPRPSLVIDAGHGGEDSGTRSVIDGRPEKEFTLDWALRLRSVLEAAGWQVYLTRTADTDMAISNRVAFSEKVGADLFLSLHFNSSGGTQAESGLETYCLTPAGLPSNLTRGFGDDASQSYPNNAFDGQNLHLAVEVHRALLRVNGNPDRGLRRARFLGVLRGQQRPAILVEGGYLSNPQEARQIGDPAHRQKLAEAVARALINTRTSHQAEAPTRGGAQTP